MSLGKEEPTQNLDSKTQAKNRDGTAQVSQSHQQQQAGAGFQSSPVQHIAMFDENLISVSTGCDVQPDPATSDRCHLCVAADKAAVKQARLRSALWLGKGDPVPSSIVSSSSTLQSLSQRTLGGAGSSCKNDLGQKEEVYPT